MYIVTPSIDQQDGSSYTRYQGMIDTRGDNYKFKLEQDDVEVTNAGSKDITVTLNGANTVIKPGRVGKFVNVSEFYIKSSEGRQYFGIDAWDKDGVTASGSVIDGAFQKVKVTNSTQNASYDMLRKTIGSKAGENEFAANLKPQFLSRKIALLGSSTIAGQGSTGSNSFFGLLNAALSAEGYTCYNRGVGGNTSQQAIARFYTDIAPMAPDFLIIGLTIGNEGFHDATTEQARRVIVNTFKINLLKLIRMAQQQNIVPIVVSQMPTQRYDAAHYKYARQIDAWIDSIGVQSIDWMGAVIDPNTLKPIASASADVSHVNDSGHRALFKSVPLSMFETISFQPATYITPPNGHINTGALAVDVPLSFTPKYALESYTVFMRYRIKTTPTGAVSLFSLGTSGGERVFVSADGSLKIIKTGDGASTEIAAAGSVVNNTWYSLAMRFNHISKRVDVYLNGVSIYTTTGTGMTAFQTLYIGGRPSATAYLVNTDLKDIVVYRTSLIVDKIKALHDGVVSQTSLELYAPLHDQVVEAGSPLLNLAATTGQMYVADTVNTFTHQS